MKRKRLLTAAGGMLVAAAVAGVAWAAIPGPGNVYTACMLKGLGTIRLIDRSLPASNLMSRCTDREIEISWNQAGQPGAPGPQGAKGEPGAPGMNGTNGNDGKDGVSVTTASEPAAANCADGGVQLTAVNGLSYVCNGKNGADGKDGANGADGRDGVSVTSAVEPAGSNCANGGSKFTSANGITFACNGANGSSGAPWDIITTVIPSLAPGVTVQLTVPCPTDDVILGGSFDDPVSAPSSSHPIAAGTGWFYSIDNGAGSRTIGPFTTHTYCAKG